MGCKKLTYFRNDTFLAVVHNTLNINEKCGVSKKRYRYNGKEKDEESGLYYYGMRYYAPWVCRFISVDPALSQNMHQSSYAFADNNPVTYVDVNGADTNNGGDNKGAPTGQAQVVKQDNTKVNQVTEKADLNSPAPKKEYQGNWKSKDNIFSISFNKILNETHGTVLQTSEFDADTGTTNPIGGEFSKIKDRLEKISEAVDAINDSGFKGKMGEVFSKMAKAGAVATKAMGAAGAILDTYNDVMKRRAELKSDAQKIKFNTDLKRANYALNVVMYAAESGAISNDPKTMTQLANYVLKGKSGLSIEIESNDAIERLYEGEFKRGQAEKDIRPEFEKLATFINGEAARKDTYIFPQNQLDRAAKPLSIFPAHNVWINHKPR